MNNLLREKLFKHIVVGDDDWIESWNCFASDMMGFSQRFGADLESINSEGDLLSISFEKNRKIQSVLGKYVTIKGVDFSLSKLDRFTKCVPKHNEAKIMFHKSFNKHILILKNDYMTGILLCHDDVSDFEYDSDYIKNLEVSYSYADEL